MEHSSSGQSPDGLIHALAREQNGVVHRQQLLAAGLTAAHIRRRLADGRITSLHRGVYLVGAVAPEWAYPQAALLACGAASTLFALSALSVWKLRSYPACAHPWVLVPSEKRIERPRIIVHRGTLAPSDVRFRHGLRLTSPPRAILDAATFIRDPYEIEALVAEGHYRGLASEAELLAQIERHPGRRGVGALKEVLGLSGGPQRTRSSGERAMLRLLRASGIAGFQVNARVCGYEVDFYWRELNFCLELDSWDAHSSRMAFERDRKKWAHLEAHGQSVMPVSGRALAREPSNVVGTLMRALAQRRNSSRRRIDAPCEHESSTQR